jgi:pterin-4a-carbinolamine dehydratase
MKLNELFEAGSKHVAFCFGRMNPPTLGHKQLLDTVAKVGGDYKIFLSQTQDKKKNPLDYATKIKFVKAMFPEHAAHIVDDASLNTIVKVASHLYDQGYTDVTFVAGSDRLEDMKKLLDAYNGVEGKSHGYYKFGVLDYKSSGDREDGAEGVAGISASNARAAAANNDLEAFKESTGAGDLAKSLFDAVRKGMNIKESISEAGFLSFLKSEPPKKKWNPAKDSRVISNKRGDDDAWIKLLLDKRRRGIELTDREWNSIQQWKLKKSMAGENVTEAPIELDPSDPMDPMIHSHDKANPAKLKYRMMRAAGQIKDLASRVDNASPMEWQTMARQFDELKMNVEQIRHALEELAKIRKKGGIRSRGIDPMIDSVQEGEFRSRDIEDHVIPNKKLDDLKSKYLPDWEMLDHKTLQAKYVAKDHRHAEEFVSFINKSSEEMDHFAEVTQDVAEVTVKTSTFDVKGLTILDFKLALKIDKYADTNDIEQVRMQGNFGMHESGYGRYWCSTDKKWKTRKGPKQKRSS